MQEHSDIQRVPVKMYRAENRLTVATPMPGVEPEDIHVEVTADRHLILNGSLRGVLKGIKDLLADEWHAGGYHRVVDLPFAVNGEMANMTYGNGVLVVSLPLSEQMKPAHLTMEEMGPTRGEHIGSAGRPVQPRTMEEHRAAKAAEQAEHGGRPELHG